MSKNIIGIVLIIIVIGGVVLFTKRSDTSEVESEKTTRSADKLVSKVARVGGSFKRGEKAPQFEITDFEGNVYKLSDYEGKVVILDFWAGWCPFCVNEMPELEKAQQAYSEDLVMIGVHRSDTEKPSVGLQFADDLKVTYLLVSDADGSLYRAAGGFGMPVIVYIDTEGIVTEIKSGPKTAEEIASKVEKLIK